MRRKSRSRRSRTARTDLKYSLKAGSSRRFKARQRPGPLPLPFHVELPARGGDVEPAASPDHGLDALVPERLGEVAEPVPGGGTEPRLPARMEREQVDMRAQPVRHPGEPV